MLIPKLCDWFTVLTLLLATSKTQFSLDGVVVFNDRKVLRFWLRLRLRLTICLISIIWGLCNDSPTLWKTNIFSIVCKAFLSRARSAFILSQDNKSRDLNKEFHFWDTFAKVLFRGLFYQICVAKRKEDLILGYVCTEGEFGSGEKQYPPSIKNGCIFF